MNHAFIEAKKRTFPLKPGTRIPAITEWQHISFSPNIIQGNYGVALDETDLVVDIDPRNGGTESWIALVKDLGIQIPADTPTVQTGRGGWHLYFTKPSSVHTKKTLKGYNGIEFLTQGAYVVGPGSVHDISKKVYVHMNGSFLSIPPAPLPLVNTLAAARRKKTDGVILDDSEPTLNRFRLFLANEPGAVEGEFGNNHTFKVAAKGYDFGLSEAACFALMLESWNEKCSPPWDPHDLGVLVRNAYNYCSGTQGSASPTTLPPITQPSPRPEGATESETPKPPTTEMPVADRPFDRKDAPGNCRLFLDKFYPGGALVFEKTHWSIWTGDHWAKIPQGEIPRQVQLALETYSDQSCIDATIRALKNRCARELPTPNGNFIFFSDGYLDLRNVKAGIKPHDPNNGNRYILPYPYSPGAEAPHWQNFLDSTMDRDEHKDLLQEWFGYSLLHSNQYQKILLLIGASRSGKGTICRTLQKLLGPENTCGMTLSYLGSDFSLGRMIGKRLCIIGEAHKCRKGNADTAKENLITVSGGDAITADIKHRQAIDTTLSCKFILAANEMPHFGDAAGALMNRLLIIPLYRSFFGKEDHYLGVKLDSELPGILNWALVGLERIKQNKGLSRDGADEERQEIADLMNPLGAWFRLHVDITESDEDFARVDDLYSHYAEWAIMNGRERYSRERFGRVIRLQGFDIKRIQKRFSHGKFWGYKGVRIKRDDDKAIMPPVDLPAIFQ